MGPWVGEVRQFDSISDLGIASERDSSEAYARYSGGLLALTTLLGLVDLHSENILTARNSDGEIYPLPVDLEIAFWDCISGMDTLLFPSRIATPEKAGLAGHLKLPYAPAKPAVLLDAFLGSAALLRTNLLEILTVFERSLIGHPVRVLLRPTAEYRKILIQGSLPSEAAPLLEAERKQLAAGDIPYFFVERGVHKSLQYFAAPGRAAFCEAEHFIKKLESSTRSTDDLAETQRVSRLIQVTALHLCRAYASAFEFKDAVGETFELKWLTQQEFELRTSSFHSRARV